MKTAAYTLDSGDLDQQLAEIRREHPEPVLVIFSSPPACMDEVTDGVYRWFSNCDSMGMIGAGMHDGLLTDTDVVLTLVTADAEVRCGVIPDLKACPVHNVHDVEQNLWALDGTETDTVCLEFCTGNEETLVTVLNSVLRYRKISLAGATAHPVDGSALKVACNGRVYEDACVYALIRNTWGRILVLRESAFEKAGRERYQATEVDSGNHCLKKLDGQRALDVYEAGVGKDGEALARETFRHPLGRIVGDAVFTTDIREIDDNGWIHTYKRISRNDFFYLLKLVDYRKVFRQSCQRIKASLGHIDGVFTLECVSRRRLFEAEDCMDEYLRAYERLGPHSGISTGGEQCGNQHMNNTLVYVVFEDCKWEEWECGKID